MYRITIEVNQPWKNFYETISFVSTTKLSEKGLFNSTAQITFGYNPNLVYIYVSQTKIIKGV